MFIYTENSETLSKLNLTGANFCVQNRQVFCFFQVEYEEKEKNVQVKIDELKENKTKLEQSEHIKRNMMVNI